MCGIAGMWGSAGLPITALGPMSEAIAHRGPDGDGYLIWRGDTALALGDAIGAEPPVAGRTVALAHRRLSIIDLSHENDQPMIDEGAGMALAYNGEVYNYIELRDELRTLGHEFTTTGDTEVVLRAYQQWGSDCVTRFVGMWALALLDTHAGRLFLSRDRFGIKPLFYCQVGGGWAFASEIKALLRVPGLDVSPNRGVLGKFLLAGVVDDTDETFFEGIDTLPAAHNVLIELAGDARPRPQRYWSSGERAAPSKPVAAFRAAFIESVRIHGRSDVTVGSCLSGGLDSSAIVCSAEILRRDGAIPSYRHQVFGYVPPDELFSEQEYMGTVAHDTGAALEVVAPDSAEVCSAALEIIAGQDEPFGTSSITAQWFVFRAAQRAGVKVMLDGQGADEVLAGYHGIFPSVAAIYARDRRVLRLLGFMRAHRRAHGRWPLRPEEAAWYVAPRLGRAAAAIASRFGGAPAVPVAPSFPSPFTEQVARDAAPLDARVSSPQSLSELLLGQVESSSLPALLRFEDRNSMAHSIEARVPFLDHRLVELAFSLDDRMKLRGVRTKHILREAMKGILPGPVRERRDKLGFRASPRITWTLGEAMRDELDQNVSEAESRWFAPSAVSAMLDAADRSDVAEATLWRVLNAKLWLRQHWPSGARA